MCRRPFLRKTLVRSQSANGKETRAWLAPSRICLFTLLNGARRILYDLLT